MAINKKPHFMRIPKEVLKDLDGCKIARRESYADVVRRLIEKERNLGGKK
jgi:predicted CopG family antitoxin